jgi:hypothetical protein
MSGYSLLSFEGIGPPGHPTSGRWSLNSPKAYWSRWAYSSVGLEHTPDKREVGSSNLPRPTTSGVRGQVPGVRDQGGERLLLKPDT